MVYFILLIVSASIFLVPLSLFVRVNKMTASIKHKFRWTLIWGLTIAFFFAYILLALSFVTELAVFRDLLVVTIMLAGTLFVTVSAYVSHSLVIELNKKIVERTKAKNKKARELDDLKDHFIFVAAHELRSPVTAIKWNLEVFKEKTKNKRFNKVQAEMLKGIGDSNEYLIELVNDLLDVSKIESGTFNVRLQPTNVEEIIDEVVQLLLFHAKEKGVKLKYKKMRGQTPYVMADSRRMKEVLVNLASNAIKYSPRGSNVTISLKSKKGQLELHVLDCGIGLSKRDISALFKKFSRVKRSRTKRTVGTGLGLYISKKIVLKMGGKIWVKSEGRGKGSTFAFSMPITDEKPTVK